LAIVSRQRLRDGARCGSWHRLRYEGRSVALDNAARFDKHAKHGDVALLVDFWASWCDPSKAMAPIFEPALPQLEPEVRLVRVGSDAAPELLQAFRHQAIPTLMLIRQGGLGCWRGLGRPHQGVTTMAEPAVHEPNSLASHPLAKLVQLVLPSGR
jgi:thioredoxin 2